MKPAEATGRLKAANPFPDGLPAPSFAPISTTLDAHEPAQAHAPRSDRGRAGVLVPAAAALVAAAIAATALVMLGHTASRSKSPDGRVPSGSLLSQFAILRRPQTARDRRLPRPFKMMLSHPPFHRTLLPGLTRIVGWLPNRTDGRVLVFVVAQGPRASHPTKISLFSGTSLRRHGVRRGGAGAGASTYEPHQLLPQVGDGYALQLVPDAVTRVKWTFTTKTIYPTINDNVAVAPLATAAASNLKNVTWYNADGHMIDHENHATHDQR